MNLNSFAEHNEESSFSFNDEMHLSDEIENDDDAVNLRRRARDFSAFINVISINSAASVKDDSFTSTSSSSSADNIA